MNFSTQEFDEQAAIALLKKAFDEIITAKPQEKGGASLCLWRGEKCLLSLFGGEASPGVPWTQTTPCLIWSASKGVASACTLHALQEKGISIQVPVSALWPEFKANGKERITLGELLSHRAGLAAIDEKGFSITDHEAVVSSLAAQPPNWAVNGTHGYGARTFGFLLDEIVRRVTGETLSYYWNRVFRDRLNLDLWFGVPEEKLPKVSTVIAPKTPPTPSPFSRAFSDPSSLTRRALNEPGGVLTPSAMNSRAMRMASIPSLGVISTADALSRFYALLSSPSDFFSSATISQFQTTLSRGLDLTLLDQTSFSAGFMTNETNVFGPRKLCFGHPGAGGSLGFADPEQGLGFAFIPSAMHPGALPGIRTKKLVQALYGIPDSE